MFIIKYYVAASKAVDPGPAFEKTESGTDPQKHADSDLFSFRKPDPDPQPWFPAIIFRTL